MTLNVTTLKERLVRLGAESRLKEINKERELLLKLLGGTKDIAHNDKIRDVMVSVKAMKKKHWTQTAAGRKRMSKIMLAKYAAGWKGNSK